MENLRVLWSLAHLLNFSISSMKGWTNTFPNFNWVPYQGRGETDDTAITLSEYQSNGLFLSPSLLSSPTCHSHHPSSFLSAFPPSLSLSCHKRYLYGAAHDHVALGDCRVAIGVFPTIDYIHIAGNSAELWINFLPFSMFALFLQIHNEMKFNQNERLNFSYEENSENVASTQMSTNMYL